MVRAKNYEIMSTFIEVMQKKTVASFFRIVRCTICQYTASIVAWFCWFIGFWSRFGGFSLSGAKR